MGVRAVSGAFVAFTAIGIALPTTHAKEPRTIRMVEQPSLSPDGKQIAFTWANEIWTVSSEGGQAKRLTHHPSDDSHPKFSPDGKRLAFVSNRSGSSQIYVMPLDGGSPDQKTFHSEGYELVDWFPDGESVLAIGQRDHYWKSAQRLLRVSLTKREAEKVLMDDAAAEASLSPDGSSILFVREGERWWRKGYKGERAAQVWQLDLKSHETKELLHEGFDCRWPLWMPDSKGFYFTKGDWNGFDLWRYRFGKKDKKAKQRSLVDFEQDSVVFPSISRNGDMIVFRHLFDLYTLDTSDKAAPKKLDITIDADVELPDDTMRVTHSKADQVAFTDDGLEIAFIAGGDLWVMDTELREPIQVTKTDGSEGNPIFAPDGKSLYFTRATGGDSEIWKVEPRQSDKFWWQQSAFQETQITQTSESKSELQFTPNGKHLLYQSGRGTLASLDVASKEIKALVQGFSAIEYSIAPDSQWIAYAQEDNDFNSEIWLARIDGKQPPTNVSRHPDNDGNPVFSPDGKLLAFTGRRIDTEVDLYYVYLQVAQDEKTARDRKLEKALEAMKKKRAEPKANSEKKEAASDGESKPAKESSDKKGRDDEDIAKQGIVIDLEDIHERLHRISIPNSSERNLLFSSDGKKLAFAATIEGKTGWYSVEFPDKLIPKLMSPSVGSNARWTKSANGILGLQNGVPAKWEQGERITEYGFSARHERSRSGRLREGFNAAWRAMSDIWYDPAMGNHNWQAIRRKYVDVAGEAHDERGLGDVVELMLGELNGSHLGFTPSSLGGRDGGEGSGWSKPTAHLGVRFDPTFAGPGLKVRDVLPDGPADRQGSKLHPNDIVLSIDGQPVDSSRDLTEILNGVLDRDIALRVQRISTKPQVEKEEPPSPTKQEAKPAPQELTIVLRPTTFARARALLYDQWLEQNRKMVEEQSKGMLGYLHIRAMDMASFYEFERQLYNVGYGRQGLVIDVRDNGGGSTTDHLLTALTQPRHAITVPRGGDVGYPHDRMVYATWNKPIIVLCNQNSYSNAEIFSHAIKVLGRGKLVGVQTAGGVVSTGATRVTDVGMLRAPFRGWFHIKTGQDMELNGALPDVVIWPLPEELPLGKDRQLEKAVEMLVEEVKQVPALPKLRYATEDRKAESSK